MKEETETDPPLQLIRGEALKFRKSIWRSPMHNKVLERVPFRKHPAGFPLELVRRIMFLCTSPYQSVLDPFGGSGTTLAARLIYKRNVTSLELSKKYFNLQKDWISYLRDLGFKQETKLRRIRGNCITMLDRVENESIQLCVNSPPYWNVTNRARTFAGGRPRSYSNSEKHIGNIEDYKEFIKLLCGTIYHKCTEKLVRGRYLVIVVKQLYVNQAD